MTQPVDNKYEIFDDLIEGIQIIDREYKYRYVNESLAKHGKSTKEALLGKTMMEKYPGIENTAVFKKITHCMVNSEAMSLTNEFEFPNGTKEYFELRIQPVSEGVLIMSFDITPRKKDEFELNKNLAERTKMLSVITEQKKQLEEFCHIIAHNMRAPLINLMLLNDMVKNSDDNDEKNLLIKKQKPIIDFLNEAFDELIDITQIRSDIHIKRDLINMDDCVKKILDLLHGTIVESNANIHFDFSESNQVYYPQKYIDSIVFNLIENSLKYRSQDRLPDIHLKTYCLDNWTYLEIKDNGLGIDLVKNGDKVFKLRKTFHEHPLARGYGLFLTKNHIEAMGGWIEINSELAKGSKFTIKLCENAEPLN